MDKETNNQRRKLHELIQALTKTISRATESKKVPSHKSKAILTGNVNWTIEVNIGHSVDDHLYVDDKSETRLVLSGTIKTDITEKTGNSICRKEKGKP